PESRRTIDSFIGFLQDYNERKQFRKISYIYQLFDEFHTEIRLNENQEDTKDWLQHSVDYIDMYFTEGITVADVAKHVGINRTHFSNMFSKRFSCTPNSYLKKNIMQRAKDLLSLSHNSITEIALSLSFTDVYTFSRSFKNYYG